MLKIGHRRVWGVALLLICIDRALKSLALAQPHETIVLIPHWFSFSYLLNTRAALSLPIPLALYAMLFVCVACGAYVLWLRAGGMRVALLRYAGVLILIGGISNLYDRLRYGGVIDMLMVPNVGACNIADIMIVVGIGLWLIHEYRRESPKPVLDESAQST